MSDTSENMRWAANFLDSSGYKQFGHSVELLKAFAAQIEVNEQNAAISALEFIDASETTKPVRIEQSLLNEPTFTIKYGE